MAKTYQQIQDEADRMFGKGASREKFEWRQAQQRAAGLSEEKRRRGGVARGWDVGKSWIRPAAQLTAGFFGGPAAASAVGAAMRGLDRPGKSGIGFDVGQGARGAMEGYLTGGLGAAARGAMTPATIATDAGLATGTRLQGAGQALKSYFQPGMQTAGNLASSAYELAKKSPAATAQFLQAGVSGYQAAQQAQLAAEEAALERMLREEEEARRRRLAQLFAPALQGLSTQNR